MTILQNIIHALLGARPVFANVATGVHEGGITKTLEQAAPVRHLLGKPGGSSTEIDLAGANDRPLGVITDTGEIGDAVNVALLGANASTLLMVASKPIAQGSAVYAAASGKVQDQPTVIGDYYMVGFALTAAAADGELLEVCPTPPRHTKVIAQLTGTASVDVANIGAAMTDGPDKIIILN